MSSRSPRFEVVRTHAGWHARFRAANGRIVWWTENYTRRARTLDAITLLSNWFGGAWDCEIRAVDERTSAGDPT